MKIRNFTLLLCCFLLANVGMAQIWKEQNIDFPLPSRGYEIKIVDASTAWAWGQGGSYKAGGGWDVNYVNYSFVRTLDGGATWIPGTIGLNGRVGDLTNMTAVDGSKAFVSFVDLDTYESLVYQTVDGGLNWSEANVQIGQNWVDNIHFFDSLHGVIIADPSFNEFNILTTSDGGATWQRVDGSKIPDAESDEEFGVQGVLTTQGSKIWFNTYYGRVFFSDDKGQTWTVMEAPENVDGLGLQMTSDELNNVYCVVINFTDLTYQLYRRNLNETSWTNLTPVDNYRFIYFTNVPGTGSLIQLNSADSKTRLSRDQGQTWMVIDSLDQGSKNFIFFKDSQTGYCFPRVTEEGTKQILKYNGSPLTGLLSQKSINVNLTAFPNPAIQDIHISMESDKKSDDYWLLINDMSGNLIYKKEFRNIHSILETINTGHYPKGTYAITISNSIGAKSLKFTVN